MSVSSLENGNLTLGNLTINNSQYAEASGYVPSQTVISSNKTGTNLNTGGALTANSLTITGNQLLFTGGGNTVIENLGTASLSVQGALTTTSSITSNSGVLQLGQSSNSVLLTGTTGKLAVGGTINAPVFTGGLGKLLMLGASTGQLAPGASYTFPNIEIPSFVGNSGSCYVVSCSNVQYYPWFFSVSYASQSGTSTYVNVVVGNAGSLTVSGLFNLCIIAMT
jgi:hypothetical protein